MQADTCIRTPTYGNCVEQLQSMFVYVEFSF